MLKRSVQLVVVILVAFTMLGAASPAARFDKVGHKLMCTCGCAEILLECNHVGCPDSPGLIAQLHQQVNSGTSDSSIFKYFAAIYGPTILAAPFRGGFDDVAWVVPFTVLILGIAGIVLLLRFWKRRHARLAPPLRDPTLDPDLGTLRDRIRNETKYGE